MSRWQDPLHLVRTLAGRAATRFLAVPAVGGVLAVALGCGADGGVVGRPVAESRPGPPAVILVSLDTLRADHLSVYGYHRRTSPFLESFAADAVVFEQASQNGGGTLPSHATMLTSLHPRTHRVFPGRGNGIPDAWTTLPERLKVAGFTTAGFVDCMWLTRRFGFSQGFDTYDDSGGYLETTLPKVSTWLETVRDTPFFLFLHSYDLHSKPEGLPYSCPEPYLSLYVDAAAAGFDGCKGELCATRFLRSVNRQVNQGAPIESFLSPAEIELIEGLYDGCINYVDDQMAQLVSRLKELGIYDRSLIIITSDHGEAFFEHRQFLHAQGQYDTVTQVPLVVKLPGANHGGTRVRQVVSLVDLMPTVLDALALEQEPVAQGTSLLPLLARQGAGPGEVYIFSGLRTAQWKYVKERNELFDLEADPGEQVNLAARQPDVVARLAATLQTMDAAAVEHRAVLEALEQAGAPVPKVELSRDEVEKLEALGYLGTDG